MEIAPLIHSRTFYCDFNPNFAVRPNDLNAQWAMNKILPAMRDVDMLNDVRRVVATDGKICIAGVACNFRYFAENYLSADEKAEAANYLHDERGREVKIFLGYAFKGSGVPDVSNSKLWQMFKKTLAPEWNRQTVETVIASYESCGNKSVSQKSLDKKFYPANERGDVEIFEQCLAAHKNFCSNVDAVKIFEDGKYDIITASQSVINRLQAEAQKKTSQQPTTRQDKTAKVTEQAFQSQRNQSPKSPEEKGNPTLLILAAAVVILAIIFFVMN